MKKFKTIGALLITGALLFFISCNSADEKKSETTVEDTTATATTATPAVEANTIVTTPQHMVIIRHKVSDFAKWLTAYEGHDSARMANGLHNYVIGRSADDSSMVLIALKADDIDKAKSFAKDPGLRQAMQKAGVMGTPRIQFETAWFRDTAVISTPLRSMVSMTVKDRDVWQKSFDDGKQERIDNGIATRVLGADPDDNKKITLVTAILDTAKARAYWMSDALKKRRTDGGVIGTPERFTFNVVKRY